MNSRSAAHIKPTGSWWTLSQRIRTFAEIPIEAAILDICTAPVYQQIAPKAFQLQQIGMSNLAIARRLGVNDKTVAKAIAWLRRVEYRSDGREGGAESTVRTYRKNERTRALLRTMRRL